MDLRTSLTQTLHQLRVERFMLKAAQDVLTRPCQPTTEVRMLRAKLILEECLETINALGVMFEVNEVEGAEGPRSTFSLVDMGEDTFDMVEVADGCADIKVVTTGTLSACGIKDAFLQALIDRSNLAKFSPGGYKREDGKWIKPPDWKKPDIGGLLREQGWEE